MSERLTLKEMAGRLKTSPQTFRRDVLVKGIPHYPVGKKGMRFDPDAVEAYLLITEKRKKSNVKLFPVSKRKKSIIVSKRFVEAT